MNKKLIALPLALIALAAGTSVASAAEPQTCRDERTGVERPVTRVLTEGPDTYAVQPGEVVAALGGDDTIFIDGASNAVICLGAGNDSAYNLSLAAGTGPVSIRGGAGDDFIVGTRGNDYLNGMDGNDFVNGLGGVHTARGGPGYDRSLNNENATEFEG